MAKNYSSKGQTFSSRLKTVAQKIPSQGLTLRQLIYQLGERGMLSICMVLTLPFLLPMSIPGSSTPFGFLIALIGIALLANRPLLLPRRYVDKPIAADWLRKVLLQGARIFEKIEKLVRPRLYFLSHGPTMVFINRFLVVFSAIMLMAPLPLPLSNTFPAYAILFLAAGSLERDGGFLLAGYAMVLLTILYFGGLAFLGVTGLHALFS
ncbi:exopolysaccharide biosynthesis protein [Heliorestis convoluta]|nr:exopolysaccharide biosynthesis protein [Heliorestis convoluta]